MPRFATISVQNFRSRVLNEQLSGLIVDREEVKQTRVDIVVY